MLYFMILMFILLIVGLYCNVLLFRREEAKPLSPRKSSKAGKYFGSKHFLEFIIELIMAFAAFGLTLGFVNWNEENNEMLKAKNVLEQTVEYTNSFLDSSLSYRGSYYAKKEGWTWNKVANSNVMIDEFYDVVFSNENIISYVDIECYAKAIRYYKWAKHHQELVNQHTEAGEEDKAYSSLKSRDNSLYAMMQMLDLCIESCDKDYDKAALIKKSKDISNTGIVLKHSDGRVYHEIKDKDTGEETTK